MGTMGGFIAGLFLGRSGVPMLSNGGKQFFTPRTYKALEILASTSMGYHDWVKALGKPNEQNFRPESEDWWAQFIISGRSYNCTWMIEFDRNLMFRGIVFDGPIWELAESLGDFEHPIWTRMEELAEYNPPHVVSPPPKDSLSEWMKSRCPKCSNIQTIARSQTDYWCTSCSTHLRRK